MSASQRTQVPGSDVPEPRIVAGVDGSPSSVRAEALLGSVSQHVVHHAPCPVVIVRDRPAHRGEY